MRIIDFHNHYYPPAYLDALRSGSSAVEVTIDEDGNPRIYYPGDYNIAVPGHRDIDYREQVLIEHGVDTQVLTLTTPGTHVEKPETAVRFAAMVNDAFADVIAQQARPLLGAGDAAAERSRRIGKGTGARLPRTGLARRHAVQQRERRGSERRSLLPLYEAANDLDAVLYIHPTHPVGVEAMTDFWLMPLVGFLCDTTLAAAKIVFSGVPERFPRIQWALCHLGGAIPYLAERLDRGFHAFSECRANIPQPPSDYLKQFYYDTVNFDPRAIQLAIDFAGVDHIMAGSDYPHQIGSIPQMIQSIAGLQISDADKAAIYGGNAARLMGLDAARAR